MRFLGIGDSCDLGALYLRLQQEGHAVKVAVANPLCHGTLAGMVDRVEDWRAELGWIEEAGKDGIILFENVAEKRGALQDELRRSGLQVIGGSAFGDRLENDRGYAQDILRDLGLKTAFQKTFISRDEAILDLRRAPRRTVVKFNEAYQTFAGQLDSAEDMIAFLRGLASQGASESFLLMDFLRGVEMGVGAYFNGDRFLEPACLDWEHKRFFPGDLGELTGEMGTIVTYDRSSSFFARTLKPMEGLLRQNGYCGYINLNTIVNQEGIWPLEFTCRFGYPGYAILDSLQATPWSEIFRAMVRRDRLRFESHPGFSCGIVLTTPPFPYGRPELDVPVGMPVIIDPTLEEGARAHIHYGEVGLQNDQLVTSGAYGWTLVVTGRAPTIDDARANANALAQRITIPDVRYRTDIGSRLIGGDLERIAAWGMLD